MSNVKVSVIMPVYNVERYLEECLDSVLGQTLQDIEVICVDDGSTDSSLEILRRYERQDPRMKVIQQQNLYAGVARNRGLEVATGTYVMFLDSDDFFRADMLEQVYHKGVEQNADVVLFGGRIYDTKKGTYRAAPWYLRREVVEPYQVFNRDDIPEQLLTVTSPAPWTKAFRREFVLQQGLRFQPLPNSNDAYFVISALALAQRITWLDEDFVNYRVGQTGNIQNRKVEHPCCFIQAYQAIYETLVEHGVFQQLKKSYCALFFSGICFNVTTIEDIRARQEIFRALGNLDFLEQELLGEPEEFYSKCQKDYKKVLGFLHVARAMKDNQGEGTSAPAYTVLRPCQPAAYAVSVVIPIYNVEDFLRPCLDSIVGQSLKNIQIICVNDGSQDGSLDIAWEYARNDARIHLVTQENGGLSVARNHGMAEATGKYLYFMDSDDLLEPQALEQLYAQAEEKDLTVVYFDADCFSEDPQVSAEFLESCRHNYHRSGTYPEQCTGAEMMCQMEQRRELYASACLQMLRRDYAVQFPFHQGILHEDNPFTLLSMCLAPRVGYVRATYFKRRYRSNSIMTGGQTFRHCYGYFCGFRDIMERYARMSQLSAEERYYVQHFANRLLQNAVRIYAKLSMEEQMLSCALPLDEAMTFGCLVVEHANSFAALMEKQRLLQKTYDEKAERGVRIRQLEEQLSRPGLKGIAKLSLGWVKGKLKK